MDKNDRELNFFLPSDAYFYFDMGMGYNLERIKNSDILIHIKGYFKYKSVSLTVVTHAMKVSLLDFIVEIYNVLKGGNVIDPNYFEKGMCYYFNLMRKHDYCSFQDDAAKESFLQNFIPPDFEKHQFEHKPWSTPTRDGMAQTYLYRHKDKVYLEVGETYGWGVDLYDDEDSLLEENEEFEEDPKIQQWIDEGFDYFMQHQFQMYRYELSLSQLQYLSSSMTEALSYLLPEDAGWLQSAKELNQKIMEMTLP